MEAVMRWLGSTLGEFWRRLSFLWNRRRVDRDLEEEMRFHVDMKARAAVESGTSAADAHRAAHLQFGGATLWREISREAWGWSAVEHLLQDLRYAARMLRHNPGFTAVAVLSLALGIGANTAVFSLIDTVLLRMLPVETPEQLVFAERSCPRGCSGAPPYPCFEQFRDRNHYFSGLSAFSARNMRISIDGRTEEAIAQLATGNYFEVLGVKAWAGRTFSPADDSVSGRGGPDGPVAVISYRYWKRRFGMSPAVLGKAIQLGGRAVTIVGVTPPEFFGLQPGTPVDVTVPIMLASDGMRSKHSYWLHVVGRLKPGAIPAQARAELDGIFQAFMDEDSGIVKIPGASATRRDIHIELTPAARGFDRLRRQFSKPLLVLMALVGLVLSIACANVANLLLARTTARNREFAVRLALGAGRIRLMRQVLTESLLLVALGGLLGLLFASWAGRLLVAFFAAGQQGTAVDLHFDASVLAFTAGASVLTGLLFGLAPAFRVTKTTLAPALKEQGHGLAGFRSHLPLAKLLVVLQVALSLVLLIGAGLFVRSLWNLRNLDAGFHPEGVLTMRVEPDERVYNETRRRALWTEILDRATRIPGVRSASLSVVSPHGRNYCHRVDRRTGFRIAGLWRYRHLFQRSHTGLFRNHGHSVGAGALVQRRRRRERAAGSPAQRNRCALLFRRTEPAGRHHSLSLWRREAALPDCGCGEGFPPKQPARGGAAPGLRPCFSGDDRPGQPDIGNPHRGRPQRSGAHLVQGSPHGGAGYPDRGRRHHGGPGG
jgi:predicted permease